MPPARAVAELALAVLLLGAAPARCASRDAADCPLILSPSRGQQYTTYTACTADVLAASAAAFSPPAHCSCSRTACSLAALSPDDACTCEDGYAGPSCESDADECASSPCGAAHRGTCAQSTGVPTVASPCDDCHAIGMTQCGGSGSCVPHGACLADAACALGSDSCALPSVTHALGYVPPACAYVPIGENTCSCASGWSGANCELFDDCASSPCTNAASCTAGYLIEDECESLAGFASCGHGMGCAPRGSSGHVACGKSYTCQCADGWSGAHCDMDVDECASVPCVSPYHCEQGTGSYSCVCPAGFGGTGCTENIDECVIGGNATCTNGGVRIFLLQRLIFPLKRLIFPIITTDFPIKTKTKSDRQFFPIKTTDFMLGLPRSDRFGVMHVRGGFLRRGAV